MERFKAILHGQGTVSTNTCQRAEENINFVFFLSFVYLQLQLIYNFQIYGAGFEYIFGWLLSVDISYDGRQDVNFLTEIHDDNFLEIFLFFDADRLDELDFTWVVANFLTGK